jgi:GH35 family endo-1,4-beta-xylanase
MSPLRFLLLALSFAQTPLAASPANPVEPPAGETLVAPSDFRPTGKVAASRDLGGESGADGMEAWRMAVEEAAQDPWLAQLHARVNKPVKAGEVCLLRFRARMVEANHESDQARFRVVVAEIANRFPRIALAGFSVDREWREIAVPFVFNRDHGAGRVEVSVDLGYGRQTVDIAGLRVLRFDGSVPLASLPRTRPSYRGQEPDAAWRHEALGRIERLRKGELHVVITDAAGAPVEDASVRAVLRSHHFQFGTAVNVDAFTSPAPSADIYRRHIVELFNAASLENALKWGNWLGEGKPADYRHRTLDTLSWLNDRGLSVRGHVMVWPGKRFLPKRVVDLLSGPGKEKIPEMVLSHIRDIGHATRDLIVEWDVLNEPINNHDLMDAFGNGVMVDWFKTASEACPGKPLYLNDWGNHDQRQSAAHVKDFEAVARYLLDNGAPLGGLGLQCHVGGVLSAPEDILATLDRYQDKFNLPVRATEFDVTIDDEDVQADYTRDFLIAMFSHPSVVGVQFWGFWENRHWQPQAALYRKDWTEKPNGAAYRTLVKETWHTDASGRSDEAGRWSARAFYGTYEVTVRRDGREHIVRVEHRPGGDGAPVRVTIPDNG